MLVDWAEGYGVVAAVSRAELDERGEYISPFRKLLYRFAQYEYAFAGEGLLSVGVVERHLVNFFSSFRD